jgi:Response regulator receiver domain
MMGGDVTVTSEPSKGSVFTVRLPGSGEAQARSPTSSSDGRHSSTADCVLVIDDDATARELIADHLKAEGFSAVTAAGGVEGLKLAKELHPTAITLDVMMPRAAEQRYERAPFHSITRRWLASPREWCGRHRGTSAAAAPSRTGR